MSIVYFGGAGGGAVDMPEYFYNNVKVERIDIPLDQAAIVGGDTARINLWPAPPQTAGEGLPLSGFNSDLAHHWTLEGAGTPMADEVSAIEITSVGTLVFEATGKNNLGVECAADSAYLGVDPDLLLGLDDGDGGENPWSLSFWHFATEASPANRALFGALIGVTGKIYLALTSKTALKLGWRNVADSVGTLNGVAITIPDKAQAWQLFTIQRYGNTLEIWVDGLLLYTVTGDFMRLQQTDLLRFLSLTDFTIGAPRHGRGTIDEIMMWVGSVLSPLAIKQLYNAGTGRFPPFV